MYDPVHVPWRRPSRRRIRLTVVLVVASLIAIAVTVVRTMPHHPPTEQLTLDDLALMIPDSQQTQLVAAIVRAQIANAKATPKPSATAPPAACLAPSPPHKWNSTQRDNATTIVQVGLVMGIPERGLVVALATAMQESQLYNLGYLGANNDHDSLGLFQQRPSMGWGSEAQVTDPVYSATAFYLALQRVSGWESMAVTVAAQRVQRSRFPNAYAKWETSATSLSREILCNVAAGGPASSA
jgi:hypothetical protein